MKAILHIGYEKTGTTTLQGFLRQNREALAGRGLLFSRAAGSENHIALAAYAQADDTRDALRRWMGVSSADDLARFRARLRDQLAREAGAARAQGVIFSNEHCSSRLRTPEEVARLGGLMAGLFDEVEVVLYLRRQDELFLSSYSTAVKSGSVNDVSAHPPARIARRFDFEKMLDLWAGSFATVTPRLYGGDVVADFCAVLGIDLAGLASPARARNQSLDATRLEVLRQLNALLPPYLPDGHNPERGDLEAAMEEASTGPLPGLPPAVLRRVMEHARASNARVAERWFGGAQAAAGDPLFGDTTDTRARAPIGPIAVEQAVETTARLWARCQREIRALRAENERLRKGAALGPDLDL